MSNKPSEKPKNIKDGTALSKQNKNNKCDETETIREQAVYEANTVKKKCKKALPVAPPTLCAPCGKGKTTAIQENNEEIIFAELDQTKLPDNDPQMLDKDVLKTEWGGGIKRQGLPFENYLEKRVLPKEVSRLPENFECFDFFDNGTGNAISAKTINTGTISRMNNPKLVRYLIQKYINKMMYFESDRLLGKKINSKELIVGIPSDSSDEQIEEIKKAMIYAKYNNVKLTVYKLKSK
jgi:hypothetical protein